jgi:hypothetical protein
MATPGTPERCPPATLASRRVTWRRSQCAVNGRFTTKV